MKRKNFRRLGVFLAASTLISQLGMAGVTAVSATEQPSEVTEQQLATFAEENEKLAGELDGALAEQDMMEEDLGVDIDDEENLFEEEWIDQDDHPAETEDGGEVDSNLSPPIEAEIMDNNTISNEQPQIDADTPEEESEENILTGEYADGGVWTFNENSGLLTIDGGTLDYSQATWLTAGISREQVQNIIVGGTEQVVAGKSLFGMFRDYQSVKSINFTDFDTSITENMYMMFMNAQSLKKLDLTSLNTSNVTNMGSMFENTRKLTELDLSKLNTKNVDYMVRMFQNATSLIELDLRNFNTEKVTNMASMFQNAISLKELDLSSFDTSNVTGMVSMFQGAYSLQKIDISSFNSSRVSDMTNMFTNTEALKELDLSNFDTSNVSYMGSLFTGSAIRKLTLGPSFAFKGPISVLNFPNAPEKRFWSHTTSSWQSNFGLDLVNYHNELIQTSTDKTFVYNWVGEDGWNSGTYAEEGEWSFDEVSETLTLNGGRVETVDGQAPWLTQGILKDEIQKIVFSEELPIYGGESLNGLFSEYINLETIEFNEFDTSEVKDMGGMFAWTGSLSSLDLSNFVTDNVQNMMNMFGVSAIENLDLRSFNTSNVENMVGMFAYMPSLQTLDLSSFSSESLETIEMMLLATPNLQKLILSDSFTFINPGVDDFADPLATQMWIHTENYNWSGETSLELMNYHNDQAANSADPNKILTYEKVLRDSGEETNDNYVLNIPATLELSADGATLPVGVEVNSESGVWISLSGLEDNQLILRNSQLSETYFWSSIFYNDELVPLDFGMSFRESGTETLEISKPTLMGTDDVAGLSFTGTLMFSASLIQD